MDNAFVTKIIIMIIQLMNVFYVQLLIVWNARMLIHVIYVIII